jgi:sarcosine oxidase subunit delta
MLLTCPHCGTRDVQEYTYLGAAGPQRPRENASLDVMHNYVHVRDNPAGLNRDFWHHSAGCRAWLVVTRDTRTHVIVTVESARAVALAGVSGERP